MHTFIEISYLVAAGLFILGLKGMSSPATARRGIVWAGIGMALAIIATFFSPGFGFFSADPHYTNLVLIIIAIVIGGVAAWISGKRVSMTGMPQMVALYNGMGGGAAAAIAAAEMLSKGPELAHGYGSVALAGIAVLGGLIGAVSFSGSVIAFAKLQGLIKGTWRFPAQQVINLALFAVTIAAGVIWWLVFPGQTEVIVAFFVLALVFGVFMTLPIGGADMPVVISLYNAFTGLAVAFDGFALENSAMIVAGTVVGAAGTLLTLLMAKAMNRSLANVLFGNFGGGSDAGAPEGTGIEGSLKPIEASDVAVMMAYANEVIIVPGYGMAVAQAQHKIQELTKLLEDRDVTVKFAIHPVAGRMPGHMNVLLAEAGVPYDHIYDLEEINAEFERADVAVVIGANDVVNPVARTNPDSPIYGMPILNADKAKNVIVCKRGRGAGFSGIENALFYADNTRMLYGDAQQSAADLIQGVKES